MNDNETDILLMKKIADGDDSAARVLISKWQKPIINFFYRSVNSVATAEDLAQTTFIKLYRSAPNYKESAAFSTYLFHIAHNVLISNFRSESRKKAVPTDPVELPAVEDETDHLATNELEAAFADAVKELPENQRSAILMLCQQELSYEEIATAMDASVPAVKTWIHRARTTLRDSLDVFLQK